MSDDYNDLERRLRYAANDRDGHGLCRTMWAKDAIEAADALVILRQQAASARDYSARTARELLQLRAAVVRLRAAMQEKVA